MAKTIKRIYLPKCQTPIQDNACLGYGAGLSQYQPYAILTGCPKSWSVFETREDCHYCKLIPTTWSAISPSVPKLKLFREHERTTYWGITVGLHTHYRHCNIRHAARFHRLELAHVDLLWLPLTSINAQIVPSFFISFRQINHHPLRKLSSYYYLHISNCITCKYIIVWGVKITDSFTHSFPLPEVAPPQGTAAIFTSGEISDREKGRLWDVLPCRKPS